MCRRTGETRRRRHDGSEIRGRVGRAGPDRGRMWRRVGAASAAPIRGANDAGSTEPSAATSTEPSPAASLGGRRGRAEPGRVDAVRHGRHGGEPVPGGYDWVTPFETATGCKMTVKVGGSSAEMVQLMKTGRVRRRLGVWRRDAAPDRRRRRGGDRHRPRPQLRQRLRRSLRTSPTTRSTASYGVPHGRGANLLMWNTTWSSPTPTAGASSSTAARPTRARSRPTTTRSTSPTPPSTS